MSDDEGIQAAELIGCAQMPLSDVVPGKVKDVWLKLVKNLEIQRDHKNRGQVRMPTKFVFFHVYKPGLWVTKYI